MQMNETINLKSENITFGHIFCIAQPIPVRKTGGEIIKWEYVNDSFMDKYRKLAEDRAQQHAPDVQAICVFCRDKEKDCVVSGVRKKILINFQKPILIICAIISESKDSLINMFLKSTASQIPLKK